MRATRMEKRNKQSMRNETTCHQSPKTINTNTMNRDEKTNQ